MRSLSMVILVQNDIQAERVKLCSAREPVWSLRSRVCVCGRMCFGQASKIRARTLRRST